MGSWQVGAISSVFPVDPFRVQQPPPPYPRGLPVSGRDGTVSTAFARMSHITKISPKVQVLALGGLLCALGKSLPSLGLHGPPGKGRVWTIGSLKAPPAVAVQGSGPLNPSGCWSAPGLGSEGNRTGEWTPDDPVALGQPGNWPPPDRSDGRVIAGDLEALLSDSLGDRWRN